jgi:hypothetical protein
MTLSLLFALAASAQVTAGSFVPTGDMTAARWEHTATLLMNGKVLITGGFGGENFPTLSSAELYDPSSGTFAATGGMTTARRHAHRHAASRRKSFDRRRLGFVQR